MITAIRSSCAADSALGVPGLIAVVRAGRVHIANPLGSGVLESAAWMGFIPAAAQLLLGEPLRLPRSRPGGAARSRPWISSSRTSHAWSIKPAYPNQRFEAAVRPRPAAGERA